MDKIKVMISSKVNGMEAERDVILKLFENNPIFELMGAAPYTSESQAMSSALETSKIATECDLYILLLGKEFGMKTSDGRSATEIEYDAAYRQNPTKILVFKKDEKITDSKQKAFVDRVCNYYSGYWRTTFKYSHELGELVNSSVMSWLKDKASIGKDISYSEYFIQQAISLKPALCFQVYYKVSHNLVEIEYHGLGNSKVFQFDPRDIYSDFWKKIYEMKTGIDRWLNDEVYKK